MSEAKFPLTDWLNTVRSGIIIKTYNSNPSGLLWEKLWRWTPESGFQSKVCASGAFVDWHSYKNALDFLSALKSDVEQFQIVSV